MRITLLSQWFDPEPACLRGLSMARWLAGRGHRVTVLTGFPNYPGGRLYPGHRMALWRREQIDSVDVVRVPLYPSHDGSALRRMANYSTFATAAATLGPALCGRSDVVHVYQGPATIGLPALSVSLLRSAPFVLHIADIWPDSVTESGMIASVPVRRTAASAISAWCRYLYRHARAVTVISAGFKQLLIERGVPEGKIEVIHNWVEEEIFHPQQRDEALATQLGIAGKFNVIYAGNLGPFQRLDVAISAMRRLAHIPDLQLVLIGTGPKEKELRALATSRGIDNVVFLPRRDYPTMGPIYNLGDALLVSLDDIALFSRTIPSKTQIALATGRPVIAALSGDAADLVTRSGAGVVCRPGDVAALAHGIESIYRAGEGDRVAMGERGRALYLAEMSRERGLQRTEASLVAAAGARAGSDVDMPAAR